MTKTRMAVVVLGLASAFVAMPARAQFYMGSAGPAENIEGFTVLGKGVVTARPNRFELDLEVSSASELTADAIVKYRDAKKRLQEAFAGLKLAKVAVEERGLLVNEKGMQMSPYIFFDSQPNRHSKVEVQLSRKLIVTGSDIRDIDEEALLQLVAKLIDVAQDAGGRVGPQNDFNPYFYNPYRNQQGLVRFILDDYDKLEEQAYEKAFADAEAKAKRLARLSRVELGPIVGVRVAASPDTAAPRPFYDGMDDSATANETPRKRIESTRFQEIPVRVELAVRFEVAPNRRTNGNTGAGANERPGN